MAASILDQRLTSSPPAADRHGLLSLAALKLFASRQRDPDPPSSEGSFPTQMLFGIRFQRAWIQDTFRKEYREKHLNVKQVFVIIIVHLVIANSYLQTQAKMYLLMQY
ncbi:hypothetical protein ZWY2020_041550 [Hordeum vulgare]|nr:hypothetical protein ZWY2020_041550 [Hordeum vulgare]